MGEAIWGLGVIIFSNNNINIISIMERASGFLRKMLRLTLGGDIRGGDRGVRVGMENKRKVGQPK